mgnify:CR=1 FL=1
MGAADHLQVRRQHGLFKHHGIDLGDGTVAHYLEGREILRSSLKEFCAGQPFSVVIHKGADPNGLTLRRAISRIGEQNYNLLFNNCEHFANWCKTGVHRSNQMEDWLKKSSFVAIAIGQFIPAALFTGLHLLLKQGLTNESSRQQAKQAIQSLKQIRVSIIIKLESTLRELESWLTTKPKAKKARALLLKGQILADQLNTIESVEAEITSLLNKAGSQN